MSDAIATIDEIARSLESADPRVRSAAMQHAVARGTTARPLALRIARAIADPDPGVAWHVPRTFAAVGRGAVEALDVLLPMLDDADEMRRTRAAFCIGAIGPDARAAIPKLTAMSGGDSFLATSALEALAGLAGDSPDETIAAPLLAALADPSYGRSSAVARALSTAPTWLATRGLAQIADTLAPEMNGTTLLGDLAPRMPDEVRVLIERALAIGGTTSRMALLAVERLEGPLPDVLVRTVLTLAGRGEGLAGQTLARVAAKLPAGAYAEVARSELPSAIAAAHELREVGWLGRALGALAPGSGAAIDTLLARFEASIGKRSKLDAWYALGDIARAIGLLADAASAARATAVLSRALDGSTERLRANESAGLDLDRALKEALRTLGTLSPIAKRAAKTKLAVDAIDAEHALADRARDERARKPDPIPKARKAKAPPTLRAVSPKERSAIAEAGTRGRAIAKTHARLTARSSADSVASAVDQTVRAMRRAKERDPRAAGDLGALLGDALVRGAGWRWHVWSDDAHVSHAVVSPNGSHAVLPIDLVLAQLKPPREVTILLLYRMIVTEKLPPSQGTTPVLLG